MIAHHSERICCDGKTSLFLPGLKGKVPVATAGNAGNVVPHRVFPDTGG